MIYFLRNQHGHIKVGCTDRPYVRFREHSGMYGTLEIIGAFEGDQDTEWQIHRAFKADRVERNRNLEWFYPSEDLLRYIAVNADLPIQAMWVERLQAPPERDRKPYPNQSLFRRIVQRISQEDKWMSTPTAMRTIGVPSHIVNRLLRNEVKYITKKSLPYYERLADWLGCQLGDLLYFVDDQAEKETA